MPYSDPNIQKQETALRHHRTREQVRAEIRRIKETTPCTDCNGIFPYYVMEFDHILQRKGPRYTIANIPSFGSMAKLRTELRRCEIVCANCHRIRTHNRREHG